MFIINKHNLSDIPFLRWAWFPSSSKAYCDGVKGMLLLVVFVWFRISTFRAIRVTCYPLKITIFILVSFDVASQMTNLDQPFNFSLQMDAIIGGIFLNLVVFAPSFWIWPYHCRIWYWRIPDYFLLVNFLKDSLHPCIEWCKGLWCRSLVSWKIRSILEW